jgi:MoxR-like ATPase
MTWNTYYRGDGQSRSETNPPLPPAPPWREFPRPDVMEGGLFQPPDGLVEAVNAALCLRRPLLVTGMPGSGKSTLIESVSVELKLGPVLRWHITSRSTLTDALYRYDVLGRIHAQQFAQFSGAPVVDSIADFLQLGPLGAALAPSERPRALLIDEIDKSDLDLPSDLLDVLERGEFRIPELIRHQDHQVRIREADSSVTHEITDGRVGCTSFPFIVMTSNGERDFPAAFLRRCVRFRMPLLTEEMLNKIVEAHLDTPTVARVSELVQQFADDVRAGRNLATDQLLNAVFLLTGADSDDVAARERLTKLILRDLTDA